VGTRGFTSFANKIRSGRRKLSRAEEQIPRRAGQVGVANIKRKLIQSDLVATTELWRSVSHEYRGGGTVWLKVDAPYAGFVEHGTGVKGDGKYPAPDFVPMFEILEWMSAKPTFVGEVSIGKAMIIANSLEEKGQREQPFFAPAWDETVTFTKDQMREARDEAF
jgi:hypothetical protein